MATTDRLDSLDGQTRLDSLGIEDHYQDDERSDRIEIIMHGVRELLNSSSKTKRAGVASVSAM